MVPRSKLVLFALTFGTSAGHLCAQFPTWTEVSTSGPSARYGHQMAYDSQRGVITLFGGQTLGPNYSSTYLGDTWEWNGTSWTQASSTGPSPRSLPAMAYDAGRGVTVLFGGHSLQNDTWEWNGTSWIQRNPSTVPATSEAATMAYDAHRAVTMMCNGTHTYEWDGINWHFRPSPPPPQIGPTYALITYDTTRQRILRIDRSGTWEWGGSIWTQKATLSEWYGGVGPYGAMTFDGSRGKAVLAGNATASNFTWEWDGASWTGLYTPQPVVRYHAVAFDSLRGAVTLFGGLNGSNTALGNTLVWRGTPGTATSFGSGCGSPALLLSPDPLAPPSTGSAGRAILSNITSPLSFMAFGWSRTVVGPFQLPLSLLGYGMPNCFLLQSADAPALPTTLTSPTSASFSLHVPHDSWLIGRHVYIQGWSYAPGVNDGNTIVSNALDWQIGF